MPDHTHSCSGDVVDSAPGGAAPRVFQCIGHLIWSMVAGVVLMGVLAAVGALGA
jgi:hypothetical protein